MQKKYLYNRSFICSFSRVYNIIYIQNQFLKLHVLCMSKNNTKMFSCSCKKFTQMADRLDHCLALEYVFKTNKQIRKLDEKH